MFTTHFLRTAFGSQTRGKKTQDLNDENILLAEIFSQEGSLFRSFTHTSNETSACNGVAALAVATDPNFDGYNDLMLLITGGA